jgi:hypothetical protein
MVTIDTPLRMMDLSLPPSVLLVGVNASSYRAANAPVLKASDREEVLAIIRHVDIELIVVGPDCRDRSILTLMSQIKAVNGVRHWVLAAGNLTNSEEVLARSLGATLVVSHDPTEEEVLEWADLLTHCHTH